MLAELFVFKLRHRRDNVSKLDMNDGLEEQGLPKQASFDSHDRKLVVRAPGGKYSLRALATSLRIILPTEALSYTLMNTNH